MVVHVYSHTLLPDFYLAKHRCGCDSDCISTTCGNREFPQSVKYTHLQSLPVTGINYIVCLPDFHPC